MADHDVHENTISFHNLKYTVQVKPTNGIASCRTPLQPKEILHPMSGLFKPGLNAIFGATGSGKTSLLDTLAGRKDPSGCEGTILVAGKRQPKNFKCMAGYVVQDDVVMGTLTVRENFMFSANLRLSPSISMEEKKQKVEEIITELGLPHCADSLVGTELIRGISGGERKRTNIGMELIVSPSFLFLDEPTTGLDASTANAVMLLLHKLGKKGRSIIFSIHQPRYSIFKLIDRLTLLSRGHIVYHGISEETLEYFSGIGYECEPHNNPADFFLDIVNGDSTAVVGVGAENSYIYPRVNGELEVAIKLTEDPTQDVSLAKNLNDKFKDSELYKREYDVIEAIYNDYSRNNEELVDPGDYATGFTTQLLYLSKRAVTNLYRNPATSVMQVIVMIVFGLIVGMIYWKISDNAKTGIQNRVGAFFFIIMNVVFGNLSSVELFIQERRIFIHENSNGFYRISAYFLAKLFCDIVPMRFIPNFFFSAIVYFMIGFQADAGKFFVFVLTLFMTGMTAASLGFMFSASVSVFAIANLLIALCYVFMMVFSGLLVNLRDMQSWLVWIKWFSMFRYGTNLLNINELKDQQFCSKMENMSIPGMTFQMPNMTVPGVMIPQMQNLTNSIMKNCNNLCPNPLTPAPGGLCCYNGNLYLDDQGIDYDSGWDLWSNMFALLCMTVLFLCLCYIQLRRIRKFK